jgi:peptidoglycan/xylan/chitin deacetylase (PgdA/CDA1 family)
MSPAPITELTVAGTVAGAVVAVAAVLTQAALLPGSQTFGRTLLAGNDRAEIALTYDDGPNDAATMPLLEVLARHNARATFFMIGRFVRQRPEIARAVHAAGHLIGNHTMSHPWLAWQPERVVREELRGCNAALEDAIGAPVRYFRPPHGARRPAVLRIARELGLTVVQWNVWGRDWEPIGAQAILSKLESGMHRAEQRGVGANVLLHDGYDRTMGADRMATVAATDQLLQRLAGTEKRLVTVDAWNR